MTPFYKKTLDALNVRLSKFQAQILSDCQSVWLSDYQTVRLGDCQTIRQSECRSVRLSDRQTVWILDSYTVRISDCQTVRLLDGQPVRLSDCQSSPTCDCQTECQAGVEDCLVKSAREDDQPGQSQVHQRLPRRDRRLNIGRDLYKTRAISNISPYPFKKTKPPNQVILQQIN